MKGSGTLVASVAAASTVTFFSSGGRDTVAYRFSNKDSSTGKDVGPNNAGRSSDKEKFAPRFDGLRFIETLVTAHR